MMLRFFERPKVAKITGGILAFGIGASNALSDVEYRLFHTGANERICFNIGMIAIEFSLALGLDNRNDRHALALITVMGFGLGYFVGHMFLEPVSRLANRIPRP